MEPTTAPLQMYGQPAGLAQLEWSVVHERLAAAPTYWVIAASSGHPHARPVWGVWSDDGLDLSIGSPVLAALSSGGRPVTVHLESGTDVVIVEGLTTGPTGDDRLARVLEAYDAKYEWRYSIDEYGPTTRVAPLTVFAWESGGWAGRDGFQRGAKWVWR